jgi:hypothetical protein
MRPTHFRLPRKSYYYRTLALNWLRYEQGCHIVTFERTPIDTESRPDVLGMTRNRQLIEVEIKVDAADLRRDSSKDHRRAVAQDIQRRNPSSANHLYYIVPEEMVGIALDELPTHCGVISPNHGIRHGHTGFPTIAVHRKAVMLHERRLSVKDALVMAKQMSGSMCSMAIELSMARLKYDINVAFEPQVIASDKVPDPYSVTDPSAVFDNGNRTGRRIDPHSIDPKWRDANAVDKTPPRFIKDVVQPRKGSNTR